MGSSMRARVAIAVLLSVTTGAAAAASVEPLSESEAIRLYLEQSPRARMVPLIQASVAAERREDALLPNPVVAYQIEDAAGVRDEFLTFQQEIPLTGRRGLIRDGADAAVSAATAVARQDLLATLCSVRLAFYEVLHRESALDRLRAGAERLDRVVRILRSREREGEGSGYDLLRAEQELAETEISISEAEAALSVARARFGSFFEPQQGMATVRLAGDLEPSGTIPDSREATELALANRGDVKALRAEALRLDLEARAARRQRFPEPILAAGWKRVEAPGVDDTGFVASLAIPLPIFGRGQLAAARARADLERTGIEIEILEREIRADVDAALAREQAARRAAERHGRDVERRVAELRTIAELAYDEGESGILELLDAHRSSLAMELRALAVRYEAKRAEIDRDRAMGAEVKP